MEGLDGLCHYGLNPVSEEFHTCPRVVEKTFGPIDNNFCNCCDECRKSCEEFGSF